MSKEQIEEMVLTGVDMLANDINQHCIDLKENYCGDTHCTACLANALYNAGYRKQSEWISVNERLPEEDVRVLVYINSERSYTKLDTDRLKDGKWVRWYEDVTHWMPLPEAPEMQRKENELE